MTDPVRDACDANFDAHQHECSGFVGARGAPQRGAFNGPANDVIVTLRGGGLWPPVPGGAAAASNFVVAGLRGERARLSAIR
jgi:hypothetical protein